MVRSSKVAGTETVPEKTGFLSKREIEPASIIVPPDGGWGWVVMMASLCCNCVVDGIVFSSGMLQEDIATEFNITKAEVTASEYTKLLKILLITIKTFF